MTIVANVTIGNTEIDDALSSLRMELTHFIYKVPKHLRDVNSKSYEPEMVTIGPYHHGKDEFKHMEEVKLRNMQSLLDRKPEMFSPNESCTAPHEASIFSNIIPTATQLKDANVKFEGNEYDRVAEMFRERRGTTVFDVEFNQDNGLMSMPALVIEDGTESLLRNLIAYEQIFSIHEPAPVTDYALLLNCLINSSKDVQILCQHWIIRNYLSNDQEVADIVNRLCENITYYSDNMMYVDMFNRINTHHKNPWNRALAVYHRYYFSSPWEYVSFGAALVLLLHSVAQLVIAALAN
ncbi:hypothetical protein ACS0TY_025632 [Phlomoides rotata]